MKHIQQSEEKKVIISKSIKQKNCQQLSGKPRSKELLCKTQSRRMGEGYLCKNSEKR